MRLDELLSANNPVPQDRKDMIKVFLEDNLSEFFYYREKGEWRYTLK